MNQIIKFIIPTKIKLLSLIPWGVTILFFLFSGYICCLNCLYKLLVIAYPLIIYYLIGATIEHIYLKKENNKINNIFLYSVILIGIDQVAKVIISLNFSIGEKTIIIRDWLHILPTRNYNNMAIPYFLGFDLSIWIALIIQLLIFIIGVYFYRYYKFNYGRTFWLDGFIIFFSSAVMSTIVSGVFWGYTLDFINLPGFFVADISDNYIYIGYFCILVELIIKAPESLKEKSECEVLFSFLKFIREDLYQRVLFK